jgi:hypothetical protein
MNPSAWILSELYTFRPCLYDVKCKQYSSRHLRNYLKLVDKMKEVDHTGSKHTRVNKINNNHSSYCNDLKWHTVKKRDISADVHEPSQRNFIENIMSKFLQEAHLTCTQLKVKSVKKIGLAP